MRIAVSLLLTFAAATFCGAAGDEVADDAAPGAPEAPVFDDRFPAWSPDGARIAFVSDRIEPGIFQLYVANADGSGLTQLTSGSGTADWPSWSPDGEWIYFESRVGLNVEIFRIHSSGGDPVQVTEGEEWSDSHVALSAKGGVAFDSNRESDGLRKIYTTAPDGTKLRLVTLNPHSNSFPAWSPDGGWIALQIRKSTFSPVTEIHVIKPDGSGLRQVTKLGAASAHASWSPDGNRIVFATMLEGSYEICVSSVDGATVERLTETKAGEMRPTFSADGSEILYCATEGGRFRVYKMKADGTGAQMIEFVEGALPEPAAPPEPAAEPAADPVPTP